MATALLGMGSNLGDRAATLQRAVAILTSAPGVRRIAQSTLLETAPVGGPDRQGAFLNAALRIETNQEPRSLLARLQQIEVELGRQPAERWSARTLDLDLLLYDDLCSDLPDLVLPHARMAFRRFVLAPAAQIARDMQHPLIGWSIGRLLDHLNTTPAYVALAGPPGAGQRRLAAAVQARTQCRIVTDPPEGRRLAELDAGVESVSCDRFIESLQRRGDLLAPSRLPGDRWTVSDFWFDQSRTEAAAWLPPERREEFDQVFAALRASVATPKLIVWLDADSAKLQSKLRPDVLSAMRFELARQQPAGSLGPMLHLNAANFSLAVDEVVAAMAAMQ